MVDRSKMPLYICGPMTGVPQFNYPLFEEVTDIVRANSPRGAVSPAEMDSPEMQASALKNDTGDLNQLQNDTGETWGDVLARDVRLIEKRIGGFVLLPNWTKSRGAKLEVFVGLLVGITDFYLVKSHWLDTTLNPKYAFEKCSVDYIRDQLRENMP